MAETPENPNEVLERLRSIQERVEDLEEAEDEEKTGTAAEIGRELVNICSALPAEFHGEAVDRLLRSVKALESGDPDSATELALEAKEILEDGYNSAFAKDRLSNEAKQRREGDDLSATLLVGLSARFEARARKLDKALDQKVEAKKTVPPSLEALRTEYPNLDIKPFSENSDIARAESTLREFITRAVKLMGEENFKTIAIEITDEKGDPIKPLAGQATAFKISVLEANADTILRRFQGFSRVKDRIFSFSAEADLARIRSLWSSEAKPATEQPRRNERPQAPRAKPEKAARKKQEVAVEQELTTLADVAIMRQALIELITFRRDFKNTDRLQKLIEKTRVNLAALIENAPIDKRAKEDLAHQVEHSRRFDDPKYIASLLLEANGRLSRNLEKPSAAAESAATISPEENEKWKAESEKLLARLQELGAKGELSPDLQEFGKRFARAKDYKIFHNALQAKMGVLSASEAAPGDIGKEDLENILESELAAENMPQLLRRLKEEIEGDRLLSVKYGDTLVACEAALEKDPKDDWANKRLRGIEKELRDAERTERFRDVFDASALAPEDRAEAERQLPRIAEILERDHVSLANMFVLFSPGSHPVIRNSNILRVQFEDSAEKNAANIEVAAERARHIQEATETLKVAVREFGVQCDIRPKLEVRLDERSLLEQSAVLVSDSLARVRQRWETNVFRELGISVTFTEADQGQDFKFDFGQKSLVIDVNRMVNAGAAFEVMDKVLSVRQGMRQLESDYPPVAQLPSIVEALRTRPLEELVGVINGAYVKARGVFSRAHGALDLPIALIEGSKSIKLENGEIKVGWNDEEQNIDIAHKLTSAIEARNKLAAAERDIQAVNAANPGKEIRINFGKAIESETPLDPKDLAQITLAKRAKKLLDLLAEAYAAKPQDFAALRLVITDTPVKDKIQYENGLFTLGIESFTTPAAAQKALVEKIGTEHKGYEKKAKEERDRNDKEKPLRDAKANFEETKKMLEKVITAANVSWGAGGRLWEFIREAERRVASVEGKNDFQDLLAELHEEYAKTDAAYAKTFVGRMTHSMIPREFTNYPVKKDSDITYGGTYNGVIWKFLRARFEYQEAYRKFNMPGGGADEARTAAAAPAAERRNTPPVAEPPVPGGSSILDNARDVLNQAVWAARRAYENTRDNANPVTFENLRSAWPAAEFPAAAANGAPAEIRSMHTALSRAGDLLRARGIELRGMPVIFTMDRDAAARGNRLVIGLAGDAKDIEGRVLRAREAARTENSRITDWESLAEAAAVRRTRREHARAEHALRKKVESLPAEQARAVEELRSAVFDARREDRAKVLEESPLPLDLKLLVGNFYSSNVHYGGSQLPLMQAFGRAEQTRLTPLGLSNDELSRRINETLADWDTAEKERYREEYESLG